MRVLMIAVMCLASMALAQTGAGMGGSVVSSSLPTNTESMSAWVASQVAMMSASRSVTESQVTSLIGASKVRVIHFGPLPSQAVMKALLAARARGVAVTMVMPAADVSRSAMLRQRGVILSQAATPASPSVVIDGQVLLRWDRGGWTLIPSSLAAVQVSELVAQALNGKAYVVPTQVVRPVPDRHTPGTEASGHTSTGAPSLR